jgi:two-component system, NarL family, invasion response regulator UvrY
MIQILIVDDHPIVRQGLRSALAQVSDMKVIDEAIDGAEALAKARAFSPDVILLDISLPGQSGLDVLKHLHAEMPATGILILSTYPEKQYAVRCLKNGALGYLTKESASEELVTAIRRVAAGRKYVSASLAELLASEIQSDHPIMPHEKLSDREFEVLCLLGKGKTVSQIAKMLSLSVPTVHTYRSRLLDKMNMHSTVELIHYVIENKLVDRV